MKVILIPGMGCTPVARSNWYSWLAKEINQRPNVECDLRDFPDPYKCRESIWLPHVESLMTDVAQTVIVGHSSGAACAMRLLEKLGAAQQSSKEDDDDDNNKPAVLAACILVAVAYTDLGDPDERLSEYFNRPWNWASMAAGARRIVLFHGTDDHLIPVREARHVAKQLSEVNSDVFEYREMDDKSHFFEPWPELLQAIDHIICKEE